MKVALCLIVRINYLKRGNIVLKCGFMVENLLEYNIPPLKNSLVRGVLTTYSIISVNLSNVADMYDVNV